MRLIKLKNKDQIVSFYTEGIHSISIYQRIFDIFCDITQEITTINFLNFLNNFKNNITINEFKRRSNPTGAEQPGT